MLKIQTLLSLGFATNTTFINYNGPITSPIIKKMVNFFI